MGVVYGSQQNLSEYFYSSVNMAEVPDTFEENRGHSFEGVTLQRRHVKGMKSYGSDITPRRPKQLGLPKEVNTSECIDQGSWRKPSAFESLRSYSRKFSKRIFSFIGVESKSTVQRNASGADSTSLSHFTANEINKGNCKKTALSNEFNSANKGSKASGVGAELPSVNGFIEGELHDDNETDSFRINELAKQIQETSLGATTQEDESSDGICWDELSTTSPESSKVSEPIIQDNTQTTHINNDSSDIRFSSRCDLFADDADSDWEQDFNVKFDSPLIIPETVNSAGHTVREQLFEVKEFTRSIKDLKDLYEKANSKDIYDKDSEILGEAKAILRLADPANYSDLKDEDAQNILSKYKVKLEGDSSLDFDASMLPGLNDHVHYLMSQLQLLLH
ncbi:Spg1-binding protein Etd1 [Schizosaccharomyces pombe]|uniref:Septation protein etd1 n=1 Tax=Schizosaccharomyces pombe (strain 972 / ATCC 24843) TaxID=284812 RepID=ETD1_SCHPO|nr:ethanol-hypersensitive mutant protein Etd1 [Schizosaccharomyces pombe]Q9UTR4.1 RecName: Full=Septation protein etd1 [Schizosaccharomyces pombe 972h-]CAB60238.1 ethanol-hypersensitive mutant protein Etd1 [Schizosaccharomyces pombe]|eukprot:NP_594855.1 ethanol-hypersensitive mutant protein Etd1 [Schizosaccharomyces pombe]